MAISGNFKPTFIYTTGDDSKDSEIDAKEAQELLDELRPESLLVIYWEEQQGKKVGWGALVLAIAVIYMLREHWFWAAIGLAVIVLGAYIILAQSRVGALYVKRDGLSGYKRKGRAGTIYSYPYSRITFVEAKNDEVWVQLDGTTFHRTVAQPVNSNEIENFVRTVKAHQVKGNIPQTFAVMP